MNTQLNPAESNIAITAWLSPVLVDWLARQGDPAEVVEQIVAKAQQREYNRQNRAQQTWTNPSYAAAKVEQPVSVSFRTKNPVNELAARSAATPASRLSRLINASGLVPDWHLELLTPEAPSSEEREWLCRLRWDSGEWSAIGRSKKDAKHAVSAKVLEEYKADQL